MTNKKTGLEIAAEKRTIVGKKVARLRRDGLIPANIYGEDFASTAITVKLIDLIKTYRKAGETQVVTVLIGKTPVPVIIHHVQIHPVNDHILHVDFRKVNLTKIIQTDVPIKIIGESAAVKSNQGVLLNLAESVLVEALPDKIPAAIEVNISKLEIGMELKIADLPANKDYTFIDSLDKVIVRITAHKEESVEVETQAPTTEITSETKETEAETTAADTAKPDEKTAEPKPTPEAKK